MQNKNSSPLQQKYLTKNPIKLKLNDIFIDAILSIVEKYSSDSIVEIGCGEGHVLKKISEKYPNLKLKGCDINEDALKLARVTLPEVLFEKIDILEPFSIADKTDIVLVLEVIEHIANYKKALENIASLKSKYFVISVPNEPIFSYTSLLTLKNIKRFGKDPEHVNYWTSKQITQILSEYFKVIDVKTPGLWTICTCTKKL